MEYVKGEMLRKIAKSNTYHEKPFDKAHALLDLYLIAAVAPTSEYITAGKTQYYADLKPGQIFTTLRTLAERWGWTYSKVERFIKQLEQEDTCEIETYYRRGIIITMQYNESTTER